MPPSAEGSFLTEEDHERIAAVILENRIRRGEEEARTKTFQDK